MKGSVNLMIESCHHQGSDIFDNRQWQHLRKKYNMTPREAQVARLVCCGYDNESLAVTLGIKSSTAKTHVQNIYRKLNVKNRISILLQFLLDLAQTPAPPHPAGRRITDVPPRVCEHELAG